MKRTLVVLPLFFSFSSPLWGETDPWVEAAVRDALVGALTGDRERVSSVRSVLEEDCAEDDAFMTGVDDDIAVLEILAGTATQKDKAEQVQKLASNLNDPVARERLLDLSKRSNDYRLEQLMKKRKVNRYTSVVNRTWQTTSQVLAGQPSALGVAGIDAAKVITGRADPTITEKKIAHLAALQSKRGEVGEKDLEKGNEFHDWVEEKKDRELHGDCVKTIERAKEDGDWWRVREFSLHGTHFWPEDPAFAESLSLAEQRLFSEGEPGEAISPPETEAPLDIEKAEVLRRRIVASERTRFTPTAKARQAIDRAESNRRDRTIDYLIFGDTTVGTLSEHSAKTAIVHGANTPAVLAFFQAAESALRATTLLFGNDLGVDEAIETYARIELENPEALERKDYLRWADLYSKKDRENEAIALLEEKGIEDERRMRKYRKRWAEGIVDRCRDLPPSKERTQALEYVRANFSETDGAREADKLLRQSPLTERSLVRVDLQDLKTFRPELTEAGFNLPTEWWDNVATNGEIEGESLYWESEGAVLWYRVTKQSPWRKLEQSQLARERVTATFAKIEDLAMARALKQERALGRRFPLEIEGALGEGSYITPKLVQYDLSGPDDLYYE